MAEPSKYSLWVAPKKGSELNIKLRNLIESLSKRFQAPVFDPHLTLLGDFQISEEEIINKTSQLARIISPYQVTLDFIDYTDNLFQSLVIRTLATKEVVEANKKARDEFRRHNDSLYVPHISIIYKEGLENQVKQELVKEIGDQFQGIQFQVESIKISEQPAGGRIEDWKMVKEISLNG